MYSIFMAKLESSILRRKKKNSRISMRLTNDWGDEMQTIALLIIFTCAMASFRCSNDGLSSDSRQSKDTFVNERWAVSENLEIVIYSGESKERTVTSGHRDYKPSWSKTGSMLTFFRSLHEGNGFHTFRTKICVINTDGSGYRELTSGQYPDFNPTWTRDATKQILFNRYAKDGSGLMQIYRISPNGSPGDENLVSDPQYLYYEWACSGLKDGRIFVDRLDASGAKSYLLTPNPGQAGTYEEITRPTNLPWHKLTVSPSETRVAYMLDNDGDVRTYNDSVICFADFDLNTLTISNQVQITNYNIKYVDQYPSWSPDENLIIYDSGKSGIHQIYIYQLADGITKKISPNAGHSYQYGNFKNTPK